MLSQDTGFGPQTVLSLVMTSLSSRNQPIPLLKQDGLLETMRRPSSESFIELSEASPRTLPSEQVMGPDLAEFDLQDSLFLTLEISHGSVVGWIRYHDCQRW